jgi:hypothetical protein
MQRSQNKTGSFPFASVERPETSIVVLLSQDATPEPDKAPLCPGSKSAAEPPPSKPDTNQLHRDQRAPPDFPKTPSPVKERPRGGYAAPQASEPQKDLAESIRDDRALEEYDVFCKPKQGSEKGALPGKLRIWEGGRVMINCLCQDCKKAEGEGGVAVRTFPEKSSNRSQSRKRLLVSKLWTGGEAASDGFGFA